MAVVEGVQPRPGVVRELEPDAELVVARDDLVVLLSSTTGTKAATLPRTQAGHCVIVVLRDRSGGSYTLNAGGTVTLDEAGAGAIVAYDGDEWQLVSMVGAAGGGSGSVAWDDITDKPTSFATSSDDITDATAVGVSVLTAADAATARAAIGAGTSDLELGSTSSTAAAGDHTHAGLTADQAAGTASIRTLGTGAQQAAAGNHTHNGLMTGSATAVEDSEAAALEDMVADFNALLTALRNRGVIAGGD